MFLTRHHNTDDVPTSTAPRVRTMGGASSGRAGLSRRAFVKCCRSFPWKRVLVERAEPLRALGGRGQTGRVPKLDRGAGSQWMHRPELGGCGQGGAKGRDWSRGAGSQWICRPGLEGAWSSMLWLRQTPGTVHKTPPTQIMGVSMEITQSLIVVPMFFRLFV